MSMESDSYRRAPPVPLTLGPSGPSSDHLARHNLLDEHIRLLFIGGGSGGLRPDLAAHPDLSDRVWRRFNPNRGK